MILTDKGNRKKKEEIPIQKGLTLEELEARIPRNVYEVGKAKIEFFGCECNLKLEDGIEEDTQQAIWFYENVANHKEDCEYVWFESL